MNIKDTKAACSAQMNILWARRQALAKTLQQGEEPSAAGGFDRVEITRELDLLDAQYKAAREGMEQIMAVENGIHNAEVSKQQFETLNKLAKMMPKMLEIYRRIASGGRVPPKDENALMNYSKELYLAAKMAAMMKKDKDKKEYDSILEDEEDGSSSGSDGMSAGGEIAVEGQEAAQTAAGGVDVTV